MADLDREAPWDAATDAVDRVAVLPAVPRAALSPAASASPKLVDNASVGVGTTRGAAIGNGRAAATRGAAPVGGAVAVTAGPLADRVALVTGSTSGIGEAAALAFASAGARVMVTGRDGGRGGVVVARLRAAGAEAHFYSADLREPGAAEAVVEAVVARFGRLDAAFNSAGIFDRMRSFHNYGDAEWDEIVAVNLSAVFRCMRAEIAAMLAGGGGSVVNNASTVGHRGSDRASPAYVAAKHGVIGLTRQAALEYVNQGIRVNAVSPGPTRTAISAVLEAQGPDAVSEALAGLNPTGRLVAAEDVAATVVFLCSDAATMVNGHDIPLDGGQLAKL